MASPRYVRDVGLLPDETIVQVVQPHRFAFYQTYLIWLLVAVTGLVWEVVGRWTAALLPAADMKASLALVDAFLIQLGAGELGFSPDQAQQQIEQLWVGLLWVFFLFGLGLAVSLIRIQFAWLFLLSGLGVASLALAILFGAPALAPLSGVVFAAAAFLTIDVYRRHHAFIITNQRLILIFDLIHYRERELLYSRLSDLAFEQSWVGRLFDFGTLIPVSVSGFGLGQNAAGVAAGVGNQSAHLSAFGFHSMAVPRGFSSHVLYGVPDPRTVHNRIERMIHDHAETTHLKAIRAELERIKFLQGQPVARAAADADDSTIQEHP